MQHKTYFGGKNSSGVYQTIINQIPKTNFYIEPFFGNGGVFWNLNLPDNSIINDIDPQILNYDYTGVNTNLTVLNLDYREFIHLYDSPNTVIYFDPPYHFSTRKSQKNVYFKEWSHSDHIEFLNYVSSLKSNVIISHYPFCLYDQVLKNWRTIDFKSNTRQGQVIDRLYINFPEPSLLQDYRYIGKNFIDRQRIKRQNKRLFDKIISMPAVQRNSLLENLLNQLKNTNHEKTK